MCPTSGAGPVFAAEVMNELMVELNPYVVPEAGEKVIPGISDAVDYCEVGTPNTIVRYTRNTYCSIHVFAQTMEQAGLKRITAKSPVGGLYFASAWAFPGGGFSGAMIGGYLAALQALNDGL